MIDYNLILQISALIIFPICMIALTYRRFKKHFPNEVKHE